MSLKLYDNFKDTHMSANYPDWLYDEIRQTGVDYTDADLVADYDRQHERFRDYRREALKIASSLGLSKKSVVLDIGCGTGGLALHLAKICKRVYAADISSAMVKTLADKIESHKLDNVSAVQSGFLTYQHTGEALDAVVANVTLHHLPDFWKQIALCRLYDLCKPGGRMFLADVVFTFDPGSYRDKIDSWIDDMLKLAGPQIGKESVLHVRDEFSTWDWVMNGMLERAGFRVDGVFEIGPQMLAYICTKTT